MHLYESDLESFRSDFLLAGNAESTVEGYLRQLRKLAEHRPEAITVRHARDFLAETQRKLAATTVADPPWDMSLDRMR